MAKFWITGSHNSILMETMISTFPFNLLLLLGNKHQSKTTVFNDQSVLSIGGRRKRGGNSLKVERPFLGIVAGVVYNNLRPLGTLMPSYCIKSIYLSDILNLPIYLTFILLNFLTSI